jgi:hypothetical protein
MCRESKPIGNGYQNHEGQELVAKPQEQKERGRGAARYL